MNAIYEIARKKQYPRGDRTTPYDHALTARFEHGPPECRAAFSHQSCLRGISDAIAGLCRGQGQLRPSPSHLDVIVTFRVNASPY